MMCFFDVLGLYVKMYGRVALCFFLFDRVLMSDFGVGYVLLIEVMDNGRLDLFK